MTVIVVDSADQVAAQAADLVVEGLAGWSNPLLGVATGSSPLGLYAELAQRRSRGRLDLSGVRGFALDEYVGLGPSDSRSYAAFVRDRIESPLGLERGAIRVPAGDTADPAGYAADYDREIRASGGVHVQVLGIGTNGHIGFNEPYSSLGSRTRVVELTAATRLANARFFEHVDEVPRAAITQGIATISEARRLVLVAVGEEKAEAVAAAVEGPVTTRVPASALQLHADAVLVLDRAAASQLREH
ncbi:glucosamine-6-phosphate deaminase [Schumannella soli]|uniref:Glucosamine-6-phosphate deaminase n=1 Tax=Schumannella soli TaxID=2590779 RepID=A0A506XZV0_9MICO|nr:glucosamine-6-phosphate deaminase [Schumannella soli]TPW74248.1 glucosamine-6-phosphate deaminase [Schumannella soli]